MDIKRKIGFVISHLVVGDADLSIAEVQSTLCIFGSYPIRKQIITRRYCYTIRPAFPACLFMYSLSNDSAWRTWSLLMSFALAMFSAAVELSTMFWL